MKKKSGLTLVTIIVCFAFIGCAKKNDTSGTVTPTITSLTIAVDRPSITADGFDEATFTVKDQNNNDVTSSTLIEVDGYVIGGNKVKYEPTQPTGTFQVKAKKDL